jgi:hypothetical protein
MGVSWQYVANAETIQVADAHRAPQVCILPHKLTFMFFTVLFKLLPHEFSVTQILVISRYLQRNMLKAEMTEPSVEVLTTMQVGNQFQSKDPIEKNPNIYLFELSCLQ